MKLDKVLCGMFLFSFLALTPGGGGGVLRQILDRGVPRRLLNPNPI